MIQRRSLLLAALATPGTAHAQATDRVRVAVFDVSSPQPYYVAVENRLLAAQGIPGSAVPLQSAPLIILAMISGDVEAASNLVTLEGAQINASRANAALYIALNGQNTQDRMEQFIVRQRSTAKSIRDLRGARIPSAPGPTNISAARAVLAANGLREGRDDTIQEQQMGVHVGALPAGTFNAAYTLEPVATIVERAGAVRRSKTGVIATHVLGRRCAGLGCRRGADRQVPRREARSGPPLRRRLDACLRADPGRSRQRAAATGAAYGDLRRTGPDNPPS